MSKPIDEWTLEELEAPALIGTDEGTHGGPNTVSVYERPDGSLYAVSRHGGAETGREDVPARGDVESPGRKSGGRVRWFEVPPAAQRRERAKLIRYAAQAVLYRPSNMPEHVVVQHGGRWWALPAVANGWKRRTEYRLPEHFRRQTLTPYQPPAPVALILLYGIPAE